MKYIDKIILEWAYRVSDGTPDAHNSAHQLILREILEEFGGEISDINESIDNLNEVSDAAKKAKALGMVSKGYGYWADPKTDKVVAQTKKGQLVPISKEKGKKEPEKEKPKKKSKPKSDEPKSERTPQEQELADEQTKTSEMRDKGEAGAGGEVASQGESRFCNAVDNLDEDKFKEENKESIEKKTSQFKDGFTDQFNKKRPNKADEDTLLALGYEKPFSDEAFEYLASREVWSEQELARMTDPENQPNVFTRGAGFAGDEKAYMDWMRAAYDGALATQEHLEESGMDISQPFQTIQSDNKPPRFIDDKVEADLEKKLKEAKTPEDKEHYERELKSFKKFREYHDTYVVGRDENGRTYIVSISNKKDSNMNDPQANTTPAARFEVMKEEFGVKTAQTVTSAIDDGIKKVTTVAEKTRKSSSQVEVDDDFATLAEAVSPKRMKVMDEKATMVDKKTGKAPRYSSGKPARGAEFACYLEDSGISVEDYNKLSRAEKLKVMQQFMGDDDWHGENGTEVAYEPYSNKLKR